MERKTALSVTVHAAAFAQSQRLITRYVPLYWVRSIFMQGENSLHMHVDGATAGHQ